MPPVSPHLAAVLPATPQPSPLHGRLTPSTPTSSSSSRTSSSTCSTAPSTAPSSPSPSAWYLHPKPTRAQALAASPLARNSFPSKDTTSGRTRDPKLLGPWRLGELVGRGTSGSVRVARNVVSGEFGAVKVVVKRSEKERNRVGFKEVSVIEREISLLKVVKHPHIIGLLDVYETKGHFYVVTEYCTQGELFHYLVNHEVSSATVHRLFCQLVSALQHLASSQIAHRDLKLENLLLVEDANGELAIKLGDLGMTSYQAQGTMMDTSCGSPHYAAPEVIRGHAYDGLASDVWSLGVILYALIARQLPFDNEHIPTLLDLIKRGTYEWSREIGPVARDLISRMITIDPRKRIKIDGVAEHEYVIGRKGVNIFAPTEAQVGRMTEEQVKDLLPKTSNEMDPAVLHNLAVVLKGKTESEIIRAILMDGDVNEAQLFYAHLAEFRGQPTAARPISVASIASSSAQSTAPIHPTLVTSATPPSQTQPPPPAPESPALLARSRSMPSVSDYSTSTGASPPRADRPQGEAPSTFLTRLAAFPPPPALEATLPRPIRTSTDSAAIAIGASMVGDPAFQTQAGPVLDSAAGAMFLSPVAAEFGLRTDGAGWHAGPALEEQATKSVLEGRKKKLSLHRKIKALFAPKSKSGLSANTNLRPSALSTPIGSEDEGEGDRAPVDQPRRNSFVGSIKRSAKYVSLERAKQNKPPHSPGFSAISEGSIPGSPVPGVRSLFPPPPGEYEAGAPSSVLLADAEGGLLSPRGRTMEREGWDGARSVHPGHARHNSGTVKPKIDQGRRSVSWIKRRKASPLPSPALTEVSNEADLGGREPAFSLDDGHAQRDGHRHVKEAIDESDVLIIKRASQVDKNKAAVAAKAQRRPAPLVFPSSPRSENKVRALGDENAPLSAPIGYGGKAAKSPRIDIFDDAGCLSAPLDPHKASQQRARHRSGAARPVLGQSDVANTGAAHSDFSPFGGALASPTAFNAAIPAYSYSDASTPSSSIMFGTKDNSAHSTLSSTVPSASPSAVAFHAAQVAGKRSPSPAGAVVAGEARVMRSRRGSILPPQSPLPTTLPPSLAQTLLKENAGLRRMLTEAMGEMEELRRRNERMEGVFKGLEGGGNVEEVVVGEVEGGGDLSADEIRFADEEDGGRAMAVSTPNEVAFAQVAAPPAPIVALIEPTPVRPRVREDVGELEGRMSEESGEDELREMLEGLSYEAPGVMWEEMLREEEEAREEWEGGRE